MPSGATEPRHHATWCSGGSMPIKYSISKGRIIIITHGNLTTSEIEGLFQQIDNDPGFHHGMSVMALNRNVHFDITPNDALHISQLMRSLRHRFEKFAIVVEKNIHFGFARMIQAYYENRELHFRVFKARKEAEAWLMEMKELSEKGK